MSNSTLSFHFEDLWEKCEKSHSDISNDTTSSIIEELLLKISLYQSLIHQNKLSIEDLKKIKSLAFGEILLTITKLSLKEDINVFEALAEILQSRNNF